MFYQDIEGRDVGSWDDGAAVNELLGGSEFVGLNPAAVSNIQMIL